MKKRILWIEDDYYAIQGLMRPLEKIGFEIDPATSAVEAYYKAQRWQNYDIIIVDLIIPLSDDDRQLPSEVEKWKEEEYKGVELICFARHALRENRVEFMWYC